MNPNRGEAAQANFETPQQPKGPETAEDSLDKDVEAPAAVPESAGNQPIVPALPLIPDDIPAASQPALPVPATDGAVQAAHAAIPDGDHIPEVWIDKTKSVIAQTKQDPYIQKSEVEKIKAEYIQKRFNKQIKVDSVGE